MEHTQIVSAGELESYADTRDSEAVIPELIWMLVNQSVPDLTTCRIPYGDCVNQPGWDGRVETENGFRQFVPKKESFWEIGTGGNPQDKATRDFAKRTKEMTPQQLSASCYMFVTPHTVWDERAQRKWLDDREKSGWKEIKILDGIQLADWLREFPAIGRWLAKKIGIVKDNSAFSIPTEHWENLQQLVRTGDPPLPPKLFLINRETACAQLLRLFKGEATQLALVTESELDAEDFVAAFLMSLDADTRRVFANRCLFVHDADAWHSIVNLKSSHVLVAHPNLDLESAGEQLRMAASRRGHAIVIPISGAWASGSDSLIPLRSPSESSVHAVLTEGGYSQERARELAGAGALSLAALKRNLGGFGELPPYATWQNARALAQANLAGRWSGRSEADQKALEILLGKSYGEWMEVVRPETLRADTPLTQKNECWKVISRGEAWSALGPRLFDDDLDLFQKAALTVLKERDPKFDLSSEERFAAGIHGKVLQHSPLIRGGMAETLALLGSRPRALSSCSEGKAQSVAILTVRELLKDADWKIWAGLDHLLPMLAEAAPDEFLDQTEAALLDPLTSPFKTVFSQEGNGVTGWNYMSGLLWALETLAWHPDYLTRVTMLLGELAAIDPGGNWANRPANSLVDIFLPWHSQTVASVEKRKSAIESLLREQPSVGWKLLLSLLPQMHGVTSGCHKPAWRNFIPAGWSERVTEPEYWRQVTLYAEMAATVAATDLAKLAELIDRLPDLPKAASSRILNHLSSDVVLGVPENERLPLWEALVDLAAKHRKFANAKWAMQPSDVSEIEAVAAKLAPKSNYLLYRRLFSERDFDLFEEGENYQEQEKKLNLKRQAAVQELLNGGGIDAVLDFVRQVTSPEKVGNAIGSISAEFVDAALLPSYLEVDEKPLSIFIRGFVWGRFWTKKWEWVDKVIANTWTAKQKAILLSIVPFMKEGWERAEQQLGNDVGLYWERVSAHPWGLRGEHLQEGVEKLLQHNRPRAALSCMARLVHEKIDFPPDLGIRTLKACLTTDEKSGVLDQHAILELIRWLQENPATNQTHLFQIEWAYLPLLDHEFGGVPKTLEQELARNPSFFCEIISTIFRSDKVERVEREWTEQEKNIARNAYKLLMAWKTVPGTIRDGSFDATAFVAWLDDAKQRTRDSGHFDVAMSQVGQTLVYAPVDPNGLWIHRSVAEALNSKDAGKLRSGFTMELFNMRGVHGFSAGKEEREIAAGYRAKAEALEREGYHRFATAMRELAEGYERDAERQSKQDPFD